MYEEFIVSPQNLKRAILNSQQNQSCRLIHNGTCHGKSWYQGIKAVKGTSSLYFIVHLIPFFLKYKKVLKNPSVETKKLIKGFIKSMLFVLATECLIQSSVCVWSKLYKFSNPFIVAAPLVMGFPLAIFQSPGRQMEMGLYNLKQGIQALYLLIRRRHPKFYIPYGEIWLFAISTALVSFYFMEQKQLFKQGYQKTLDPIFKDI